MSNVKAQMPNKCQMTNGRNSNDNVEARRAVPSIYLDFGIHLTFGFWNLDFSRRELWASRHT
jgi:hypothetical protein